MSLLLQNVCHPPKCQSVMKLWRSLCPIHRYSKARHSFSSNRYRPLNEVVNGNKAGRERVCFGGFLGVGVRNLWGGVHHSIKVSDRCSLVYFISARYSSKARDELRRRNRTSLLYITSVFIFMVGMSYAGVPLYRMFCQSAGLGGQAVAGHDTSKVETMEKVKDRTIRIRFNADVHSSMRWNFKPQQTEIKVLPGETALAFYTAKNPTDKPIIGISTYNVVPFEAGQYFNKIQCFCFEEQILNPHEQVDMPVFFYIDPEFAEDPKMQPVQTIVLSYTFFEAKEGLTLPMPSYATT